MTLNGRIVLWCTRAAGAGYLKLGTSGIEKVEACVKEGRPVIFAGWHGHNFISICVYVAIVHKYFKSCVIMVPESREGRMMEDFAREVGLNVVKIEYEGEPSSVARAAVGIIKLIRNGSCALLAPDGPRGPHREAKGGIAVIGQKARAMVIPSSAAASRSITLRWRWDKHLVPLPFSRAIIHFGDPIDCHPPHVPPLSAEELRVRIEAALRGGAEQAKLMCRNRAPKGPAGVRIES